MTQMTEKKKPLIILTGPTAVGKTAASIGLAKAIGGEIISADSMQVYRHMDIGSAKILPEEMKGVKHYLIDVLNPEEDEYWKYDIPYFLLVPVVFHDYSLWKLSVGTLFLPVSA